MQDAKSVRPKEFVRRVQLTALSPIPHPASGAKASGFGPDSAFCILHLHPASGAVHSFGADSAFCILHLHPA